MGAASESHRERIRLHRVFKADATCSKSTFRAPSPRRSWKHSWGLSADRTREGRTGHLDRYEPLGETHLQTRSPAAAPEQKKGEVQALPRLPRPAP